MTLSESFGGADGARTRDPGVTGRYSNQLNYRSAAAYSNYMITSTARCKNSPKNWRPLGDSNPCTHREG